MGSESTNAAEPSLGFSFHLVGGAGKLAIRERTLFEWVQVDRLELEVPDLPRPVDMAAGPTRFQRRRTRVTLAALRMDQADLDRFAAQRALALADRGLHDVRLGARDGYVLLSGRVRRERHAAELSARLYLRGRGGSLEIYAADTYAYGYLPTPPPRIAHDALVALFGDAATPLGLGQVALAPLQLLLWRAMPPAGWRLPDASAVSAVAARATPAGVVLNFAPRPGAGAATLARGASELSRAEAASYVEALPLLAEGDDHLAAGQIDAALRAYRRALADDPEQPQLAARVLAIEAAHPASFRDALELARDASARWAPYGPAHAARAAVAVAEADPRLASDQLRELADTAALAGDDDVAARAALAAARLIRRLEPTAATELYERVLAHRPGLSEAVESLAERYEDEQRWHDLASLLRSRAAATGDREPRARALVRLASVIATGLGDPAGALVELERATQIAPELVPGWEALADAYGTLGDTALAVRALDTAAELYATRGDLRGQARSHVRVAEVWRGAGELGHARSRFERALELAPDFAPAIEGAAASAAAAGEHEHAAALWERRLATGASDTATRAAVLGSLGRARIAAGDADAAREPLAEAAGLRAGPASADAWLALAELDEEAGDRDAAIASLARALDELLADDSVADDPARRARAAAVALRRAELGALPAELERAWQLSPDSEAGRAAARALYGLAHDAGDAAGARRWLDALAGAQLSAPEALRTRLARARLAVDDGAADRATADLDAALEGPLADQLTADQRADALALRAEVFALRDDPAGRARALTERARALGQRAEAADALVDATHAWLEAGDPAEALALARRAEVHAAEDERSVESERCVKRARAVLGAAAWQRRSWDDVIRAYRHLADAGDAANPNELATACYRLGVALDHQGDLTGAIAALERVVEIPEVDGELCASTWRVLAGLYDRAGDNALAARAFECFAADERAQASDDARADAWYRAGELYRKQPDDAEREAAERCLEAALRLAAAHMPALDALERLKFDSGDHERVAAILGRKIAATARQPARQKALLARLAELQATRLGRPDVARESFARALELDPNYRPALRFLAEHAQRTGDGSEALRLYARLAHELPDDDDDLHDADVITAERREAALAFGDLLTDVRRATAHVDGLAELIDELGEDSALLERLARALRIAERWSEAADALGRRATLVDDPAAALPCDLQRIAIYATHIDDPAAAWAACCAALGRAPLEPALLAVTVGVARRLRDPAPLIDALEACAELPEACVAAGATRADLLVEAGGLALYDLGDRARAAALFRAAIAADSACEAARFGLAQATNATPARAATDGGATGSAEAAEAARTLGRAAQDALDEGDPDAALTVLAAVERAQLADDALALRAELYESSERWHDAADDLSTLRDRAAASGERDREHRVTRRLAALARQHLHDDTGAAALYERALELDPEDLAAAEALVGIHERRRDRDRHRHALERVLSIARATDAGLAREAGVLRELAQSARADRTLARAAAYLDRALELIDDPQSLRARAELAVELGDYPTCAHCLETLATQLAASGSEDIGDFGPANSAGEVLLELAGVYADGLHDRARSRDAMCRAAAAFAGTPRADATWRMLAADALGDDRDDDVVAALEAVPDHRRTGADLVNLAKALKRLGRDRRAVSVLRDADAAPLPDEAGVLLLALSRELERQREHAAELERGAAEATPGTARRLLAEALPIYDTGLDDADGAARVRRALSALGPVGPAGDPSALPPEASELSPPELERAAEQALASEESERAAALFAHAIAARARALDARDASLDGATRAAVARLREIAGDGGHWSALADGLHAAAAVERDPGASVALLRESAAVRHAHLDGAAGAADTLGRALALTPGDRGLFAELEQALRATGDHAQLVVAFEHHIDALDDADRVRALRELAALWIEAFGDEDHAARCRERADAVERALVRGTAPDIDDGLRLANELEARGQLRAAASSFEQAAERAPDDARPLEALTRLYAALDEHEALDELYGKRIALATSGQQRARLWLERARLNRDVLHREPETYRSLKQAYANAPSNRDIVYTLRTLAIARGEWSMVVELLYRELAAAPNDRDKAGLHLELALISDEKLLDFTQACIHYEQALELDPEIPAAPGPLSRLYVLAGRHDDAARMGELAARYARDDATRSALLRRAAACAERAGAKSNARRLYGLAATVAVNAADSGAAQALAARVGADAEDAAARIELLEIRLRESEDQREQLDLRHELLELAVTVGDAGGIRRHAGALLEADAGDLSAFVALRRAATAVGDWSVLAYLLRTRASAVPDQVERAALFYELGRLCLDRLSDYGGAIAAFEEVLASDPNHPAALETLAEIAYYKSDWTRARQLYASLRPESCSLPGDVLAYRRGEIAEALGDLDEAAAAYAEACGHCPSNRMALAARARTALQLGDLEIAVDASRAIIDFLPADDVQAITAARLQVAELSRRAGMIEQAIEYFETVLSENPNNANALSPLATLYQRAGRWDALARTLSALGGAAGTPSERAKLEFELGEVYREHLDDWDRAAEAYLRAIDLDPDHVPTLRRLIDVYARAGDVDAAMEVLLELQGQDRLLSPETGAATLARSLVVAAQAGDTGLAIRIAERLSDVRALADAMLEWATREPGSVPSLAETAHAVTRTHSVVDSAELIAAVRERGGATADELARTLDVDTPAAAET